MKCDVLIIGAGLAGCTCAKLLAQGGKDVVLVDRADLSAKDKLCGGLLTPRAVEVLERIYGTGVRSVYACEHNEMRVLVAAHDRTVSGVRVVGTHRKDLDQYALDQARAMNVEIFDDTRIETLNVPAGKAVIEIYDGSHLEIGFEILVAADGAASMTRKQTCEQYRDAMSDRPNISSLVRGITDSFEPEPRFARPCPAELIPSLEAYIVPNGQPLTGKYDARLHGYGWYIPCGEGGNIGFDGASGTTRAQLRSALDEFAHDLGVTVDESTLRGAFIPSGSTVLLQLGGPGVAAAPADRWPHPVYFAGDAAGLAAPATGEGIYFALRSGEMLAKSLVSETASYRSLMSHEAATLKSQYDMLDVLFNEDLMEASMSFSHASGVGPDRMARFALKLFASF